MENRTKAMTVSEAAEELRELITEDEASDGSEGVIASMARDYLGASVVADEEETD